MSGTTAKNEAASIAKARTGPVREATAPPATVAVYFNDVPLGTISIGSGFTAYDVALPAELAVQAGAVDAPARITLESSTWRPRDYLPVTDDRALGVMLDRVEVH